MGSINRRFLGIAAAAAVILALSAAPAQGAKKSFLSSDDAKEREDPQKFLPDYDKLTEGKDADWVYFPSGGLKGHKTVTVMDFDENGKGREAREAARDGKEYMEQWLDKEGFKVVEKGGDLTISGNVFNAWEPSGGARYWGGWMANPGVGLEVIAKDSSGKIVAEVRHKERGSTIEDAVENALENVAKALADGK